MTDFLEPRWSGYLADPFVIQHEGFFYAYGTGTGGGSAHEEGGRVIPVLRSKDLEHWEYFGGCLEPPRSGVGERFEAFWAPEVAYKGGLFYLFYSTGGPEGEQHKIRVATSLCPEGPFEDAGKPLIASEPFSIDPCPFYDPQSAHWYLFFARDFFEHPCGTGLSVARLAGDFSALNGPLTDVARACESWQIFERDRLWYGKKWPEWYTLEGPSVLFHQGKYFCFYSGGNWRKENYGVTWSTADTVTGPWTPSGKKLLQTTAFLRGPGHCSFFEADGKTHIAFHAWDHAWEKRQLHIAPLEWRNGEPYVEPGF